MGSAPRHRYVSSIPLLSLIFVRSRMCKVNVQSGGSSPLWEMYQQHRTIRSRRSPTQGTMHAAEYRNANKAYYSRITETHKYLSNSVSLFCVSRHWHTVSRGASVSELSPKNIFQNKNKISSNYSLVVQILYDPIGDRAGNFTFVQREVWHPHRQLIGWIDILRKIHEKSTVAGIRAGSRIHFCGPIIFQTLLSILLYSYSNLFLQSLHQYESTE